jgi:hypothetical protein
MSTQSPDTKTERMTAQVAGEHLREQIKIINDIHRPPRSQPIARAVGDNALQEELGRFGEYQLGYYVDETKRDILLVNGRRDAASAAFMANAIYNVVYGLRIGLWVVTLLLIGLIVLVAPMALKHWPL